MFLSCFAYANWVLALDKIVVFVAVENDELQHIWVTGAVMCHTNACQAHNSVL